jgi:hypothetical protein
MDNHLCNIASGLVFAQSKLGYLGCRHNDLGNLPISKGQREAECDTSCNLNSNEILSTRIVLPDSDCLLQREKNQELY